MRKVMGWLLVATATFGLFPLWMQVTALEQGQVDTPEQAHYQVSASAGLVTCTVPSAITLQKETDLEGSFFECTNNYNASLSLTWAVVDDGGGGFLTSAGSSSLLADGVAACQDVTLSAGSVEDSRTVIFRGRTGSSSGLYVELYFTADVTVQAGSTGLGGGCAKGGKGVRLAVLAALLLAVLLSLPTTLAVRTALVGGEGQVAVVSTSSALLSLTPGTEAGNAADTAYYRDTGTQDTLVLDFRRGLGSSSSYGFPPNSLAFRDKYRFRGLFTVTNRSDESLCISVHVPGGGVADLAGIYVRAVGATGSGTATAGTGGSKNGCVTWLSAGETFEVDFWWEINSTGSLTDSFSVRVEGTR